MILDSQCHDFSEIKGQAFLKRALEIAVTGRHNILLIGAPGCGKTMALDRISSIMNSLSEEEYLEVQALYQATGRQKIFVRLSENLILPYPGER